MSERSGGMSERGEPGPGEYDDSTRPLPPAGGVEPADRTQRLPGPADRTGGSPPPPDDATRALPPDRTASLPPERSTPPAWSGRAEVPVAGAADEREPADWYAEEPGGRRWWLPILWGVLALLLVALVGGGLWWVLRSADDEPTPPAPSATPSVATTRASPSTRAPATSAAPTRSSPSAPATTAAAAQVPMPPLENVPLTTAQALLDRVGIGYRVEYRASDRPAGTVLETDPGEGEPVGEGDEVTLVVSRGDAEESPAVTPSVEPTDTDD